MAGELFTLSDNLIQITGLINEVSGAYINDATVTATVVKKSDRTEVAGVTWPIAVVYVAASDGIYRGTLPYTMDIADREKLIVLLEIDGGAGLVQHRECSVTASIKSCA
jgi:hypothetical protein